MAACPLSIGCRLTRSTSAPATIDPMPRPIASLVPRRPTTLPTVSRGLRVWIVVNSPTASAEPGIPDKANSTTYTQSDFVTYGAFQNTSDTRPNPRRPTANSISASTLLEIRPMMAEPASAPIAIVPRIKPSPLPSSPRVSTTNTTKKTTNPPCATWASPSRDRLGKRRMIANYLQRRP